LRNGLKKKIDGTVGSAKEHYVADSSTVVPGGEDWKGRLESSPTWRKVLLPPGIGCPLRRGLEGEGMPACGGALSLGGWHLGTQARASLSLEAGIGREGARTMAMGGGVLVLGLQEKLC
jgi:hypothetical protein